MSKGGTMAGPQGKYDDKDYVFPLPNVAGLPKPSTANYEPSNVAPLIEGLAGSVPTNPDGTCPATPFGIAFRYENNTPDHKDDDIIVAHPQDMNYLNTYLNEHCPGSIEQNRYEFMAKKSARLQAFQESSPAEIEYFQQNPSCP